MKLPLDGTRLLALMLLLRCGGDLAAQPPFSGPTPPPPSENAAPRGRARSSVDDLVGEAERHMAASRLDAARAAADEAFARSTAAGDRLGIARASRMTGIILAWEGRDAEAKPWLERAVEAFRAAADEHGAALTLSSLAVARFATGDEAAARAFAVESAETLGRLGDARGRAIALLTIDRVTVADSVDTRSAIDEALAIARRSGDDSVVGTALKQRAARQFAGGELAAATISLDEAIAALDRSGDAGGLGAAYLQLGRVLRAHGDNDGALRNYRRAAELIEPTGQTQTLVEAVNATGVALAALGRHRESIDAYERGLAIARASGNQRLVDFMLGNLGGGLLRANDYQRAVEVLLDVLSRKPDPYIAAFRNTQVATALGELARFDQALPYANEAIRLSRELNETDQLASRLGTRAWILERLGRLDEALADHRETLTVVERVRSRLVPADFLKRGYGDKVQDHYAHAIDLATRLGRFDEALQLSEQARARAFLDLLATRRSSSAPVGDAVLETRGTGAEQSIGVSGATDGSLRSDRSVEAQSVAALRALAARLDSALLSYWVNDDSTVAWVVNRDGTIHGTRLPVGRDRVSQLVRATVSPFAVARPGRQSGPARPPAGAGLDAAEDDEVEAGTSLRGVGLLALGKLDRAPWRDLHEALISPLRAALPPDGSRLTIVPHGPLFRLSFAALQEESGRYLIERYDISYAPSAAMLATEGGHAPERGGPWLLVGNPASMPTLGGKPLAPLPAATRELSAIKAFAPKGEAITLDGRRASETELEHQLSILRPAVLHFATHGVVSDDPTQPSFLALSAAAAGGVDGRLSAERIYAFDLATDLVVLSACRTGAGQVTGDGIVGLTRAFFAAGAASVVASFWDVADEPTYLLMRRFYRGYGSTGEKSRSLRDAQLALLDDLRAGRAAVRSGSRRVVLPEHPLLWAGFFLSGER